jgi:predicted acetyltransferase
MALEVRTITDAEVMAFRETVFATFGAGPEVDEDGEARHRAILPIAQSWAAFDGSTMVATAGTFDLAIGVPGGGTLPMAGLTMVSVRPTHRRRGLLKALMRLHFDDARARNYAISGLWASEAAIYGRFGYGLASYCDVYDITNAHSLVVAGASFDDVEWVEEPRARELLPAIYARATAARPGALRRDDVWWRERRFLETPWSRAGASTRRHVLARRGNDYVGYLVYRQRTAWTDGTSNGRVEINELLAVDPRAEASLWKFALSVDLFPNVGWWNTPADCALPWLVPDMRRIKSRRGDGLWLRIEDVPAALASRRYGADGTLRIGVGGWTYELEVADGAARCAQTSKDPSISCDIQALATLFLGCAPATTLANASRVRGDAAAIALADRMFASAVAPWCPEVF